MKIWTIGLMLLIGCGGGAEPAAGGSGAGRHGDGSGGVIGTAGSGGAGMSAGGAGGAGMGTPVPVPPAPASIDPDRLCVPAARAAGCNPFGLWVVYARELHADPSADQACQRAAVSNDFFMLTTYGDQLCLDYGRAGAQLAFDGSACSAEITLVRQGNTVLPTTDTHQFSVHFPTGAFATGTHLFTRTGATTCTARTGFEAENDRLWTLGAPAPHRSCVPAPHTTCAPEGIWNVFTSTVRPATGPSDYACRTAISSSPPSFTLSWQGDDLCATATASAPPTLTLAPDCTLTLETREDEYNVSEDWTVYRRISLPLPSGSTSASGALHVEISGFLICSQEADAGATRAP